MASECRNDGLVDAARRPRLDAAAGARALPCRGARADLRRLWQHDLQGPRRNLPRRLGALDKTGARAIVAAGWGGLQRDDLPASVFALDEVPHDWLFDRVDAIIHHGGAGTDRKSTRLN